jgi:hypothetical protein
MSTIKVTNVSHPSAASPAIVLDADGNATVAGMGLVLVKPTSIANSGGSASASGGAVTFTGVTSVSLNGVFTSDYENYRITIQNSASASSQFLMRMRVGGTDNTAANYSWSGTFTSSLSATYSGENSNLGTSFAIGYSEPSLNGATILDVTGPYLTLNTSYFSNNIRMGTSQSSENKRSGALSVTTSYDGITILPGSGTITGTIRVYGYSNGA